MVLFVSLLLSQGVSVDLGYLRLKGQIRFLKIEIVARRWYFSTNNLWSGPWLTSVMVVFFSSFIATHLTKGDAWVYMRL